MTLWSLLPRRPFVRSIAVLAGGTAIAQVVTIAAAPFLTRLYSPGDFGHFAAFAAMLGLFIPVVSLRYDIGIPLPKDENDAINLTALSILVAAVFALSLAAVFNIGFVSSNFGLDQSGHLQRLLPIALLGGGIYQALCSWAVRSKSYHSIATTHIVQSMSGVGTQIGLAALSPGASGLVAGQTIGPYAAILRLLRQLDLHLPDRWRPVTTQRLRRVASRYGDLPKLSTASALLNAAGTQVPTLMLVWLFGPVTAGLYFLTQRVIGIPASVVGQAVQRAYFGESADIMRNNPSEAPALFWRVVGLQALTGIPVLAGIALVAPWLFDLVFGSEWRQAGAYLMVLAPMYALQYVAAPVGITLAVVERQDLFLYREIARLALVVTAMGVVYISDGTAEDAIWWLAITGSCGYCLHIYMSWYGLASHFKKKRRTEVRL